MSTMTRWKFNTRLEGRDDATTAGDVFCRAAAGAPNAAAALGWPDFVCGSVLSTLTRGGGLKPCATEIMVR